MCDIDIHPDAIGRLPGELDRLRGRVARAATLPAPDTGATATATRSAIGAITDLAAALVSDTTRLGDDLRQVLRSYEQADDNVAFLVRSLGGGLP